MANTFTLIEAVVLTSSQATIDFTSIPATFTDLCLKFSCRTSGTSDTFENIKVQFNGLGGTAYSERLVYGNSSTALSASNISAANTFFQYSDAAGSTANTFSNGEIYIPNYTSANFKSVSVDSVTENNSGSVNSAIMGLAAELFSNAAAINRITFTPNVATVFVQHSTAYLYGIKNS